MPTNQKILHRDISFDVVIAALGWIRLYDTIPQFLDDECGSLRYLFSSLLFGPGVIRFRDLLGKANGEGSLELTVHLDRSWGRQALPWPQISLRTTASLVVWMERKSHPSLMYRWPFWKDSWHWTPLSLISRIQSWRSVSFPLGTGKAEALLLLVVLVRFSFEGWVQVAAG